MPTKRPRIIALILVIWIAAALVPASAAYAQEGDDPAALLEGAQIYAENCAVCHGLEGEGRVGATLSKDWPAIQPDLNLRNIIVNGVPGTFMPPWGTANGGPLSDEQIDLLVDYVLSWQTGDPLPASAFPTPTSRPPIEPIPDVEGDPNKGAVLYGENCALCHGENGEGRVGATLAKDWPAIRPDLSVRNVIATGVPGTYMPPWSQANGGPLADEDVDDLVAYVLTWSTVREEPATAAPAPTSTPVPEAAPERGNLGLILSGVVLVLIIIGGVYLVSRNR
jgi:mono/diheme cytochrome c family protein